MSRFVVFVLFILSACITPNATVEEVEPGVGGTLGINMPQNPEARAKAKALMAENCGGKYYITKEGYVVTGSQTSGQSEEESSAGKSKYSKSILQTSTRSEVTTTDVKEWRINYKCGTKGGTKGKKKSKSKTKIGS